MNKTLQQAMNIKANVLIPFCIGGGYKRPSTLQVFLHHRFRRLFNFISKNHEPAALLNIFQCPIESSWRSELFTMFFQLALRVCEEWKRRLVCYSFKLLVCFPRLQANLILEQRRKLQSLNLVSTPSPLSVGYAENKENYSNSNSDVTNLGPWFESY